MGELAKYDSSTLVGTPDGMRHCRRMLVDELLKRGHEVYSVLDPLELVSYPGVRYSGNTLPDLDLLFCEWRWIVPHRGPNTKDLLRQSDLLKTYHCHIPVILYDAAFQITAEDEKLWPKAVIADPSIEPRHLSRRRERLYFWSNFEKYCDVRDPEGLVNYGYIGNDYDRPEVFDRFYTSHASFLRSEGIQTVVVGNWIDRNDARPDPGSLVKRYPNVCFVGRQSFRDSMKTLNSFIATTHLCKPEYDRCGNITIRFTESMSAGVPGLVPSSFRDPFILGHDWCVESAVDVVERLKTLRSMSFADRYRLIEFQKQTLLNKYDVSVEQAAEFIESHL